MFQESGDESRVHANDDQRLDRDEAGWDDTIGRSSRLLGLRVVLFVVMFGPIDPEVDGLDLGESEEGSDPRVRDLLGGERVERRKFISSSSLAVV